MQTEEQKTAKTEQETDTETETEPEPVQTEQQRTTKDETGPRPECTYGPRDQVTYSAGTSPRGDRPEANDQSHSNATFDRLTGVPGTTSKAKNIKGRRDGFYTDINRRRLPLYKSGNSL